MFKGKQTTSMVGILLVDCEAETKKNLKNVFVFEIIASEFLTLKL